MRERYLSFVTASDAADTSFHYHVTGSPWQLYHPLTRILSDQEHFPAVTVQKSA